MRRYELKLTVDVPAGEPVTRLILALEEALDRQGCELQSPVGIGEPDAAVEE